MPGSGKSYIGKRLAEYLGYVFVEIDPMIEKAENKSLEEIVTGYGVDNFLDLESQVLIDQTSDMQHATISPGGSVVYREASMSHLKNISKIVYLKVSFECVIERIGTKPRGIVYKDNQTIADLYSERIELYKTYADYIVDGSQTAEKVISQIIYAIH